MVKTPYTNIWTGQMVYTGQLPDCRPHEAAHKFEKALQAGDVDEAKSLVSYLRKAGYIERAEGLKTRLQNYVHNNPQTKGDNMTTQHNEAAALRKEIAKLKGQLKRRNRKIEELKNGITQPTDESIKAAKMREVFVDTKIPNNFSVKKLATLHDNFIRVRGKYIRTTQLRVSTDMAIEDICSMFRKLSKLNDDELGLLYASM